jgi:hypothetical protein
VIAGLVFVGLYLGVLILVVAGLWKAFAKAGKPGWAAIVPVYNLVVMVEISGRPLWWVVLFFVPFVNLVAAVLISIDIAKAFGKDVGFGLGLAFLGPIFWPILGFGSAEYQGSAAA